MDNRALAIEAIGHLRVIQHGAHLIDLYRKFFPRQFKLDRIDYSSADSVLAFYSRFNTLVDHYLFPLFEWEWMETLWDDPEHALGTIPVYCTSNTWFDRFEEDLSLLEKTIISGVGLMGINGFAFRLPNTHEFDHGALPKLCKPLKGPIKRLPAMVDIVLCGTMNPWIDCSQEEFYQSEMPDWSEETVRALAKDWCEAKRMRRDYAKFEAWALAKPERIRRIERLLKAAWVPKEEMRVRCQAGRHLVEIPELTEMEYEEV